MKKILFVFILMVMAAPAFAMEEVTQPVGGELGVVVSPDLHPEEAGIKECGVATKAKQTWSFDNVKTKGNNLLFPASVEQLYWFAQFTIKGSMKNDVSRDYKIQWISPDGKTYHEENFKSSLWNETFIKKPLKFDKISPEARIGRWRVRVWKKDTLVDDRYFELIKNK